MHVNDLLEALNRAHRGARYGFQGQRQPGGPVLALLPRSRNRRGGMSMKHAKATPRPWALDDTEKYYRRGTIRMNGVTVAQILEQSTMLAKLDEVQS
jgi:hypothetical protein